MLSLINQQPIVGQKLRKSGINTFDAVPWGTHFCQFYQTRKDLLEVLVPYFKAGLENNEYCIWILSEPLLKEEAIRALRSECVNLDKYMEKGQIMVTVFEDWYRQLGSFDMYRVMQRWIDGANEAIKNGYEGLRVSGDICCNSDKEWEDFIIYEKEINNVVKKLPMLVICAYCTGHFDHNDTMEVFDRHEYVLTKRRQAWAVIEGLERIRTVETLANRKLQEQFIDILCHELRNPLNGVFGSIDLMKDIFCSADKTVRTLSEGRESNSSKDQGIRILGQQLSDLKEHTGTIYKCAKYQKSLVDDVLSVSKLQAQKVKLSEAAFDPNKVVLETCELFKAEIEKRGFTLCSELQKENLLVLGDADRLKQVLINLLSNAIKFNKEKGKITIRLNLLARNSQLTELKFEVEDSGIGMSNDEVGRLFNRFEQMGRNTYRQYEGSGLGLVISKGLVELMGGHFKVESEKQKGTKFSFNVVLKTACQLQQGEKNGEKDPFHHERVPYNFIQKEGVGVRVLIVEDNQINQKILVAQLRKEGCTCFTANNGKEAVDVFNKQPLDIILMDIEMPVMNGMEAAKIIRGSQEVGVSHNSNTIPIICLSGYTSDKYLTDAAVAKMDGYLTKPYEREKLLQKMNECLNKPNAAFSVRQLNWAKVAATLAFFRANKDNPLLTNISHIESDTNFILKYIGS